MGEDLDMLKSDSWSDGETVRAARAAPVRETGYQCVQTCSSGGSAISELFIFPSLTLAIFEWR